MLDIIVIVFVLLCVSLACWTLWSNGIRHEEPPELSGSLPLIGHGLRLIREDLQAFISHASNDCIRKGGLATCWIGYEKWFFITDPEAFLMISNTCLEKHYIYKFTKPVLGDGLTTADVSTWKSHRKLLNPTFSTQLINGLIETFNSQAKTLVDLFSLDLDKPYDHKSLIRAWNLEAVCFTTSGMQFDGNYNLRDKYLDLEDKLLNIFDERLQKIWFHNDFLYKISKLKKRENDLIKEFIELSNLMIQKKKDEFKTTNHDTEKLKTFLEGILDLKQKNGCFTHKQVREHIDTIICAGFDTTATTLNILFILLGSYPDLQQKVYQEILEVLDQSDRDLGKYDLPKLIFTEAVIKETMRLFPVAPIVARHIDRDMTIKNYTLKKNTTCILSIYGLNRNPNWGPDADQFRPERWLDAATLPDHNNFGTFSVGKRNCIGKAYAMIFMKTVLVHVIRRYQISANINNVVFKWRWMISPVSGHRFTLKQRNVKNVF